VGIPLRKGTGFVEFETLRISSGLLDVDIARPENLFSMARFDHTGFITQVTFDSVHTFCTAEAFRENEGTGGIGLCNEFGLFDPIGYDTAALGEYFPKVGAGLLRKPDINKYSHFYKYDVLPFTIETEYNKNKVTFTVQPMDCRGYAVRQEKIITVTGNILKIEYYLDNVGELPVLTTEYCHNFISFDYRNLGPEYHLRLYFDIENEVFTHNLKRNGNVLSWHKEPNEQFYCRFENIAFAEGVQWELFNEVSQTGVVESSGFRPSMAALWGDRHVVSPEVFVKICINPSKSQSWYRQFEFFKNRRGALK